MFKTSTIKQTLTALVAIATVAAATPASAYERWIDIVNEGDTDIVEVYVSHIDTGWGYDLLGWETIYPGYEATVEPRHHQGYCKFDALVGFADGSIVEVWNFNLCEATTIFVDNYGYATVSY